MKEPDSLYKQNKTVYEFHNAARQWYLRVCSKIKKITCIHSKDDLPLFSIYTDNQLRGILLIHVDEFTYIV